MRLIDADALDKRIYNDIPIGFFGSVKRMAAIRTMVEEAPTVTPEPGWISVKDRLPEIRHAVLVYTPYHYNLWAASLHEDGDWYFWMPGTMKYDPDWYGPITYWMPLPEPPKEDKCDD